MKKMDEALMEAFSSIDRDDKLKAYKKITISNKRRIALYKFVFFKNDALLVDKKIMGDIDPTFF